MYVPLFFETKNRQNAAAYSKITEKTKAKTKLFNETDETAEKLARTYAEI